MEYPKDLGYTKTHEWVRLEGDVATVGITDFAVEQLGDIVYLDLPGTDTPVTAGERFGEIESSKSVSDLVAPLSGRIVEANASLVDQLDLLGQSPYGEAWLIKIKVERAEETQALLSAASYGEHVAGEAH